MLARQLRLAKEKDFKKIFKRGKSVRAEIFRIKILANELENNRYGFVISANVSKKATERNKLKRQLKAAIKEYDKKLVQGLDFVFIISPAALNRNYEHAKNELKKIFFTLKLFKAGK